MMNYNKIRFLSFADCVPLNDRLVFSALAAISSQQGGSWVRSVNQLAKQLYLHHGTVKAALTALETLGWVVSINNGKKWRAVEPPQGVLNYFQTTVETHWSKRAYYLTVELSPEYDASAAVILAWLKSGRNKGTPTPEGLASLFGIDKRTVDKRLTELRESGLLDGWNVLAKPATDKQIKDFAEAFPEAYKPVYPAAPKPYIAPMPKTRKVVIGYKPDGEPVYGEEVIGR